MYSACDAVTPSTLWRQDIYSNLVDLFEACAACSEENEMHTTNFLVIFLNSLGTSPMEGLDAQCGTCTRLLEKPRNTIENGDGHWKIHV